MILLARVSHPHVALLGRIPGTNRYSDLTRHPENEALSGVIAFRPDSKELWPQDLVVTESWIAEISGTS